MDTKFFIIMSILLSSLFGNSISGQDIPNNLFQRIDEELCVKNNITFDFFDLYLKEYPSSDYLIGMKAYFLNYNVSKDSASAYIKEQIVKNSNIANRTFTLLALGVIETGYNKESLLLKSIAQDSFKVNKWARLELFYYYEDIEKKLKAIQFLTEALEIDPFFTNAVLEQVNISIESREFKVAETLLSNLEEKFPDYYWSYQYKGELYEMQNRFYDAIFNYSKVLKIDSTNVSALLSIGKVYQIHLNEYDKALNFFLRAYNHDKNNIEILISIGSVYVDLSKFEHAIDFFEKSLEKGKNYESQTELIYSYIQIGNIKKAELMLEKTINDYGHDFRIDFFKILLSHMNKQKIATNDLLNDYYRTYNREDYMWLKNELSKWKIEIKE